MKSNCFLRFIVVCFFILILVVWAPPLPAQEKNTPPDSPGAVCPLEILKIDPLYIRVSVKNVSGKKIVGVAFNAAQQTRRSTGHGSIGVST